MGYDIIGDIHGHAERLEDLLGVLGYEIWDGAYRHPERQVIFVGDFIDRGPEQIRTLELVRAMLDTGSARAVMGNHELNAIAWATADPLVAGHYLRARHGERGAKNRHQHEAFLREVGEDSATHAYWIEWMMGLPLWIEEADFQVIHACWSDDAMAVLRPQMISDNRLTVALVEKAHQRDTAEFQALELLLKGPEISLPEGYSYADTDGIARHRMRIRWWDRGTRTYKDAYCGSPANVPDLPMDSALMTPEPDRPTFIGHYWFEGQMKPAARRVACVDYSMGRGGKLAAYRFDGESVLSADKFIAVKATSGAATGEPALYAQQCGDGGR